MSGLKEEFKPTVHMMKLQTLREAFEVAMLQEQSLELSSKEFKANAKWNGDPGGYWIKATIDKANTSRVVVSSNHKTIDNSLVEPKKIFAWEIQHRRNLGLCFKYGEKYGMGPKCNLKNFSFMIIDEDEESEPLGVMKTLAGGDEDTGAILDMCLNALII